MTQAVSIWVVLLVAMIAANLPFVNDRLMGVIPMKAASKPLSVRVGELLAFYALAGAVGFLFERRIGQIAPQGWEFYTVTGALFIVLAFPGFTWRYLLKRRKQPA